MNIKSFLTVILILYCIAGLAFYADADDKTDFTVKDVEYLKGTDFVQLYFKIGKMIPIPDVFYPEKGNTKRIVMRINNVTFQLGKNQLSFDSAIIDSLKIDGSGPYTDVDILLKQQVNYRVFTNRKGLYIEFPFSADTVATNKTMAVTTPRAPATITPKTTPPVESAAQSLPNIRTEVKPQPAKAPSVTPTLPPIAKSRDNAADIGNDESVTIKDIILSQKDENCVKFDIILSRLADFSVIPIPTDPIRLAIDFQGVHGARIQKIVEQLNVKKIRGSYNSASIYRVVFDLHYLKNYKVSPKNGDGNILEVTFFNKTTDIANSAEYTAVNLDKKKKTSHNDPQPALVAQAIPTKQDTTSPATPAAKKIKKPVKDEQVMDTGINQANTSATSTTEVKVAPIAKTYAQAGDVEKNDSGIIITRNESGVELSDPSPDNPVTRGVTVSEDKTQDKAIVKAEPVENKITAKDGTIPVVSKISGPVEAVTEDFFSDEKSEVAQDSPAPDKVTDSGNEPSAQITYLNQTIATGKKRYVGDPMGFNFHNADLKDVIKIIAKISGLNIVMDPGISGRVTAQLTQVPWDQALELFLKINNLSMIQEGNILRIGNVSNLAAEARQRRELVNAKQDSEELEVFTKTMSFAKVGEAAVILKEQLSERGKILQDPRTNTLIISDIPDKIQEMKRLIKVLDTANPQVSIEARIVETNANFIESFGIQWGYNFIADATHGNQTTLKFPNSVGVSGNQFVSDSSPLVGPLGGYAVNLPATGATSGTVFTLGNVANTLRLDMALSAMQTNGEGRIISAPKTTTQNNQEATIMQGKQIPVQTIQNNTITVVYKPAALELKVTPQITADGTVVTKLEINNNSADFGNLVNGIPPITTQAITTTVMVADGGTIVIGGMYKVEKTTTKSGVPLLSKIPLLGNLFKNSSRRNEQKELLIFITPRIIK